MNVRNGRLIIAAIFVALLIGEQCIAASNQIKIGALLPLTGPLGYLGEAEKNAIQMAEEKINMKGKILTVVIEDSKGKPAEAATIANKLIDIDNVDAMITATTSVSRAVLPIADRNKRVVAALCMDPTIQKESPFSFRLYEGMDQEAELLLSYYAHKSNGNKRIGLLYVNHAGTIQQLNDYFIPGFKKMGAKVVYQEPYELTEKDFRVKIDKLRAAKVDSLIIIGFGFEYQAIFKQLAQYDIIGRIEITGGWGFIAPNNVPSELLENVVVAAPKYLFEKNEQAKTFETEYTKKFGRTPTFDAAFAYDAVGILSDVLSRVSGDIEGNRGLLKAKSVFNGVMGSVVINEDGSLDVPMALGTIKAGKIVPLELKSK